MRKTCCGALSALLLGVVACGQGAEPSPEGDAEIARQGVIEPCPYDEPCEPYEPPPPPPPAAPRYLNYTPFTEGSSVTVSWTGVYDATWYALERYTGGAWNSVYTGSQTEAAVAAFDGVYQFRVRACNDSGCSEYTTDLPMRVSKGPARSDISTQGMSTQGMDTQAVESHGVEQLPYMGHGFDNLRLESTGNGCLEVPSSGFATVDTPARSKDFSINLVTTREELARSLHHTKNLGVSAKYGKFKGSYKGTKELVANATRVEETTLVVATLRDQFRVVSLYNRYAYPINSTYVSMLQSGQGARFRNHCGDGFIHTIAYGRDFYITFQLTSLNYTQSEIKTQTNNLQLDLQGYSDANYDSTKKEEITRKYQKYGVVARVVAHGSGITIPPMTDLATAMQYMKDFQSEPTTTEYPIAFSTADYEVPSSVPASQFPDYRTVEPLLETWYSFDRQIATRCEYFDDDLHTTAIAGLMSQTAASLAGNRQLRDDCFNLKRAVLENVQNCEDTTKWGRCVGPRASSCVVPATGEACVPFAERLPVWMAASGSLRLDGELGGGMTSASKWVSSSVCVGGPAMLDQRIYSIDCSGSGACPNPALRGVVIVTESAHRASNASQSWSQSNGCLSASVKIERPGSWKSGARIHQSQTAHALSPTLMSYLLP